MTGNVYLVDLVFLVPSTIYTKQELSLTMLADSEDHVKTILSQTPYAEMDGFKIGKIELSKDAEVNEEVVQKIKEVEAEHNPEEINTKLN